MTRLLCVVIVASASAPFAQPIFPDIILPNGKIITLTDKVMLPQAVAVQGGRHR